MAKQKKSVKRPYRSKAHPSKKDQPQSFHKVYWPFIPSLLMIALCGLMIFNQPTQQALQGSVLSYATEISRSGLLSAHNSERTSRDLGALAINSKLNTAAQNKANDMVARDYWSHNTPDGKEPWYFINQTGYAYLKAGENLAYGFASSSATVDGWMNSAGHRANVLNTDFSEVGFGYANSANFVGSGEQTIVVAMYAKPRYSAPAPAPTPAPTPPATTTTKTTTTTKKTAAAPPPPPPAPAPVELPAEVKTETPVEAATEQPPVEELPKSTPYTSDVAVGSESKVTRITRIQAWTHGAAPWSAAALSLTAIVMAGVWVGKHARMVKRAVLDGEDWVLHHPLVDFAVLTFVTAAVYLTMTTGIIK